uniref:Fibronectin type-III domain-containing protein n=1 Tax=Solibacter usitatus (strain Ellin6076) TaxID=234267 RepID=Q026U6_SOLUE
MLKFHKRLLLTALLSAIVCLGPTAPVARGQAIEGFPLVASNFSQSSPRGFGDRNNSWAQSMIWWNNNLYVGSSRNSVCASLYAVYAQAVILLGPVLANQYLPYPPTDPDLSCAPNPADLPMAAEIWRWSPRTNLWQRVYQSPVTLPNPGPPPEPGKFVPYEDAFRGFAAYTESDGTQALYAFSVNTTLLWDRNQLPPPRILRTTDGVNWAPIPQAPGTFLGTLPFNPDHSTYRSPAVYNGKMFVLCGPVFGQGSLIASANPSQGNDAWFLAGPPDMLFYELAVFNGWLYIGGYDPVNGYAVFKTQAQGTPPYQLITVVPPGAGLTNRPSKSVVSMFVHYGRLYVGTATFAEMVRINPDDTWDLVMGTPRIDPVTYQWKYPLSNLDAGFGLTLNDHVWYQDDPYNYLYAGTYNADSGSRNDPVFGPELLPSMGGHLYVTPDDWYFTAVTTTGFSNVADPHGGKFDYGFRTMASTPYGMFLGTANDYYGLMVFRATKAASPPVQAPGRLIVEPTSLGSALLSWRSGLNATSYQVWRAQLLPILVRDDVNFEGWNGVNGTKIPDVYVSAYQLIGTTTDVTFLDSTVQPGMRYMYYIVGVGTRGVSPPSNLVTFPLLLPSVTFTQLLSEVSTLVQRQRFAAPDAQGTQARQQIVAAQAAAAACQITTAINTLTPQSTSRAVLVPDLVDYQVLVDKLIRRLQLFSRFPTQMITSEFCTGSIP